MGALTSAAAPAFIALLGRVVMLKISAFSVCDNRLSN